ncbi:MAG: hypothetical protein JSW65_05275 [Candidatus Bipolaricaulota bacterium]|nr:MAG: hypothetical protein JSW65_05275 [Candidatus Bipolaricaulota bacterium]
MTWRRWAAVTASVAVVLLATCAPMAVANARNGGAIHPIPAGILYPGEFLRALWARAFAPDLLTARACETSPADVSFTPRPIPHVAIPDHPFMASRGGNNMHCDSYISDTYRATGPIGPDFDVASRSQGFGGYGTVTFDRAGRLVAVHSNGRRFQLELMDPYTLEEMASYDLPPRPWYWLLQGIMPWEYIGAGMYFYLDYEDRAVVPTTKNTIQVIQVPSCGEDFTLVREYDLRPYVVPRRWPHRDSVAWVLPDWSGACYWFATTGGVVGTVEVDSGHVRTLRLDGEIIENSFAAAEDGVFILSDRALYRLVLGCDGSPVQVWRTSYDRGPGRKPGHITRGSGTSVSLLGGEEGLVAYTDNAEPKIHLLLARRRDGEVVCSVPLFREGKSGTDISVACFERVDPCGRGTGVYSILAENNWGHHNFPRSRPEPGLTRVDVRRCQDGQYIWEEVWSSDERSIGVFKLSLGSGLAYMYWRSTDCPVTTWFLTAIDYESGETVYKRKVGTGLGFNNWAGALFLHPDGGTLYSTTIFGLVMIRDVMR